jgi:hypothetical protein
MLNQSQCRDAEVATNSYIVTNSSKGSGEYSTSDSVVDTIGHSNCREIKGISYIRLCHPMISTTKTGVLTFEPESLN